MANLVVLDGYVANPGDLSWDALEKLGRLTVYDRTGPDQLLARAKEADVLLVNKIVLGKSELEQLPRLKCICTLATGYNVIDVVEARKRGIPVCNAVGYSSPSVAQHVFALMLAFTNQVALHNQSVQGGAWAHSLDWTYSLVPLRELRGMSMGILGFGKIGQEVGNIGLAFGMEVLATHRHPMRDAMPGVSFVDFEELCKRSDFLSLHVPLTPATQGIINRQSLSWMKKDAILINTSRGGLVVEDELQEALIQGRIGGAALDVLVQEPPPPHHPLYGLSNCLLTPHQAWLTQASRQRLLRIVCENVAAFLRGDPQNVVNPPTTHT